jgi:hypothetical protein
MGFVKMNYRYDFVQPMICVILFSVIGRYPYKKRLRWSRGSVLAFGTQVRGFKPGRDCRIFKGENILSMPSFGGEVNPSVPCRRALELRAIRILGKIRRNISRPRRVPPSDAGGLSRRWSRRHLAEKVGTSKGGEKWQPTFKNLPGCSVPEPYRSPD